MSRVSDIDQAVAALAADPSAVLRYPLLSQREDWPPQVKNAPGILPDPTRNEERAYWAEINQRVADRTEEQLKTPEHPPTTPEAVEDRPRARDDIAGIYERVRAAELAQGEARRQAFIAAAPAYRELFERLNAEMVRAGVLRPEDVRSWEAISRAFRDDGFDRLLAEARANEAQRTAPGPPPAPAPIAERQPEPAPSGQDDASNWWRPPPEPATPDETDSREHIYERN